MGDSENKEVVLNEVKADKPEAEKEESDEFIISEALKMYSELDWDEYDLKIRLLELLKDRHF